jgi:uncharacterized protein (DUF4415 family)
MTSGNPTDPAWEAAKQRALQSLKDMSDEEVAAIERGIAADPDNPKLTDEQLKGMRRVGRPPIPVPQRKVAISIRLSPDLVAYYREQGPGWQTRIDATLRWAMEREKTMRLHRKADTPFSRALAAAYATLEKMSPATRPSQGETSGEAMRPVKDPIAETAPQIAQTEPRSAKAPVNKLMEKTMKPDVLDEQTRVKRPGANVHNLTDMIAA